ncbi:MAG: YitT family protein [Clostridia bacterium]|nr:YitT family protein [Clostridia bacterium]
MNFRTKRTIIKIRYMIIQFIQIVIGTAIIAFGTTLFLLPNQLSAGGFSGLGTITYYLLGIPLGNTTLILNAPLFIISLIKNGKKFFIRALEGTVLLSIFFNIFEKFKPLTEDRFLACIYGGIIIGIGTAIILKANASTGGTDLLTQIVKAFKPNVRISSLITFLDIIIVTLNVIVFKELEIGLYSAITIYIMGKMLDIFFEGINFGRIVYIISSKYEDIAKEIGREIKRGSTALKGIGMYKNEQKNVLMCVASRGEVREIRQIVKEVDKKAFIVISNAREVFGEGFKEE